MMTSPQSSAASQPILVVLVWRGGERFARALESLRGNEKYFSRIIFSVTAPLDSPDLGIAQAYMNATTIEGAHSKAELICTGRELPTMEHQRFWIDYLLSTGASPTDWIYWLAYDDQVRGAGIERIVDEFCNWTLTPKTAYFGPWALRHESADELYSGPWDAPLESWTSFPSGGPLALPVADWIGNQIVQPTYMQMSGSVVPLAAHYALVHEWPKKRGPMRIEMATAQFCASVAEFPEPVSIIYGRSNSDRTNYAKTARKEDVHLTMRLVKSAIQHPSRIPSLARNGFRVLKVGVQLTLGKTEHPSEEWRVRGIVNP